MIIVIHSLGVSLWLLVKGMKCGFSCVVCELNKKMMVVLCTSPCQFAEMWFVGLMKGEIE